MFSAMGVRQLSRHPSFWQVDRDANLALVEEAERAGVMNHPLTITYYGYNGFIIRSGDHKLAIDPGAKLFLLGLGPVIPRQDWNGVTHVLVTHADPDHYWHADRLLAHCGAPLVCGDELIEITDGRAFMAHPRRPKLDYSILVERAYPLRQGELVDLDGVQVRSIPAFHGDLRLSFMFGAVRKTVVREPDTLFAKGETGFVIELGGVTVANLGDSLLMPDWEGLRPHVLMIPIGGREIGNTMDEDHALEAVTSIQPKLVIPCHYDCGVLFRKNANPADAQSFKRRCEAVGVDCVLLEPGQSTTYLENTQLSLVEARGGPGVPTSVS
ncbi:MAG: MBL fold metallo-hydrolase [Myxococcota bacterium]